MALFAANQIGTTTGVLLLKRTLSCSGTIPSTLEKRVTKNAIKYTSSHLQLSFNQNFKAVIRGMREQKTDSNNCVSSTIFADL